MYEYINPFTKFLIFLPLHSVFLLIISYLPGNKTAVRKKTLFIQAKTSCDLLATRSKTDTSRENNRHEGIIRTHLNKF
jgi:hypothetical protein